MNVLVVGSGIFGLSSALACALRGMRVTIVDAGSIPSAHASSHDVHRLFRYPYGSLRGYARLAPAALRCWRDLFEEIGERWYVETGTLAIGDRSTGWIGHSAASLRELDVEFEMLSPAAAGERYPYLIVADDKEVLYTPTGGVLLADRILRSTAARLAATGALLMPGVRVTPERLRELAADTDSDAVIVATGSWTALPSVLCDYPVTPVRQVVAYLDDPPPEFISHDIGECPMILDLDEKSGFYLVPSVAGTPAKIGDHLPGRPDSDDAPRTPDPEECARLKHLAGAGLGPSAADNLRYGLCRYAMTPDRRFILRAAAVPGGWTTTSRIVVVGGGSGHGFKFGPLIGRLAADVVDGSMPPAEAERIAAGRARPGGPHYLR